MSIHGCYLTLYKTYNITIIQLGISDVVHQFYRLEWNYISTHYYPIKGVNHNGDSGNMTALG